MQIQVVHLDISDSLARGFPPVAVIKRENPNAEHHVTMSHGQVTSTVPWYTLAKQLSSQPLEWSINKTGPTFQVRLSEYNTRDAEAGTLVQLGLQLGSIVTAAVLPNQQGVRASCDKLLIALGNVFARPDGKAGYQCWIGFACRART